MDDADIIRVLEDEFFDDSGSEFDDVNCIESDEPVYTDRSNLLSEKTQIFLITFQYKKKHIVISIHLMLFQNLKFK